MQCVFFSFIFYHSHLNLQLFSNSEIMFILLPMALFKTYRYMNYIHIQTNWHISTINELSFINFLAMTAQQYCAVLAFVKNLITYSGFQVAWNSVFCGSIFRLPWNLSDFPHQLPSPLLKSICFCQRKLSRYGPFPDASQVQGTRM